METFEIWTNDITDKVTVYKWQEEARFQINYEEKWPKSSIWIN